MSDAFKLPLYDFVADQLKVLPDLLELNLASYNNQASHGKQIIISVLFM